MTHDETRLGTELYRESTLSLPIANKMASEGILLKAKFRSCDRVAEPIATNGRNIKMQG